ncbi:MAG: hypothetical protein JSS32_09700 [Verrucomicrobia bacterium]|nr:hypothetical protein [Verrucomicrobiota bacterium]
MISVTVVSHLNSEAFMLGYDYWWIWILKVLVTATFFSLAILSFMPKVIKAWQSGRRSKQWFIIFSGFMYIALFLLLNIPHSKNLPTPKEKETLRQMSHSELPLIKSFLSQ